MTHGTGRKAPRDRLDTLASRESAPVPGFTVEEPALPVLRHLLDRLRQLDMPTSDVRLERVFEILDRIGVKPDWQESLGIAKAAYVTAQQVR